MNINTDYFMYSTKNRGKGLQYHDDETMDFLVLRLFGLHFSSDTNDNNKISNNNNNWTYWLLNS